MTGKAAVKENTNSLRVENPKGSPKKLGSSVSIPLSGASK
jgi:hypothetical protein